MLKQLWHFLLGYVMIRFEGVYIERALTRLAKAGVALWDVKRDGASVYARMSIGDFIAMRRIVRGLGIRVRIAQRSGLPPAAKRARRRFVLAFGWLPLLAAIVLLSQRLWFFRFEGLSAVDETEMTALLADMGVTPGIMRRDVETYDLGTALMYADERISFCGTKASGVVLTVTVREANASPLLLTDGEPSSIYAAKDGVLTELTALSGKPQFHAGDAVKRGDELITGVLNEELSLYTAARGSAVAQVCYCFSATAGPELERNIPTGDIMRFCVIQTDLFRWSSRDESVAGDERLTARYRLTCSPLPVTVFAYELYVTEKGMAKADLNSVKLAAALEADTLAVSMIPHDARIVSKQTEYTIHESGAVTCVVTVITEEDIGVAKAIYDGRNDTEPE